MAFTFVTVTRDYDLATSEAPTGGLYFTPSDWMVNGGVTIAPAARYGRLDAAGIASITLAANTDPGTTPTGTHYLVEEAIQGQPIRRYAVVIPHNAGPTVNLSTLPVL